MKKHLTSIIVFLLFTFNINAQSRIATYTITSLEGKPEKLILIRGEVGTESLTIQNRNNKLTVPNYWSLKKVSTINNFFIKIEYAQRGGSCVGIGRTLLLCISKDKLIAPLAIMDELTGCGAGEDDLYKIELIMANSKIGTYKLNLIINDRKIITDHKLGKSYNKHWLRKLEYDITRNIFHNGYQTLSGNFMVVSEGDNITKEYINGNFPIVSFMGSESKVSTYYYIKDAWYEYGQKNYLIKIS